MCVTCTWYALMHVTGMCMHMSSVCACVYVYVYVRYVYVYTCVCAYARACARACVCVHERADMLRLWLGLRSVHWP